MVGVLAAAVVLVAVGVVLPASTDPIPGNRGVAELTTIASGAHRLGLMIRGVDTTKPILLFVRGAPGAAERGAVRAHLSELERHFVVATVDRRGGGSSYPSIEPTATLSLNDEIDNTLAAANYLRQRFRANRIYLLAHSGGTIPAVFAAQRQPELFRAYVGVGQAVDLAEADRAQYAETLAWARRHHRTDLVVALTAAGPPPYSTIYGYEPMVLAENEVFSQGGGQGGIDESIAARQYTLLEKVHPFSEFLDTYSIYYPRVQDVDLRTQVARLKIPAYFVDGENEVPARLRLMREWLAELRAPRKEHIVLADSAHRSMYERPAEFTDILVRRVLADTLN
ncbi:alpha/beta fold hydrolase [Actinopolymorpha alba]|uniref:alpha/beta fold hydrolase n=1 Tax=Actinopolymorpha alba TaxID=533267 RepID=UPI00035E6EA1|nr:alpha/beta fold hydrolase [Actinopolymorpha alba]